MFVSLSLSLSLMRLQGFSFSCLMFEICKRIAFCSFVFGDNSTGNLPEREIGYYSFLLSVF